MKFVVPLTIPSDAVDVRHDERLPEHLDHRDRRADRRLEPELATGVGRRREELRAASRDELLVRRDDRAARLEQREDVAAGGVEPAHHLGDEPDRRVVEDLRDVGRQDAGARVEARARSPGRERARATTRSRCPVARSISSPCSVSKRWTAAPTVP